MFDNDYMKYFYFKKYFLKKNEVIEKFQETL